MTAPPLPFNETLRLKEVHRLGLLDSEAEERFDRLSRLTAHLFQVPIVLISLVDENRQWFKSSVGLEVCESGRDISFCGYTILERRPFVIPDALADPRFHDNPLVTGPPHVRFYAGIPLETDEELLVGTLCIIDHEPRIFTEEEIKLLQDVALLVRDEMNSLGHRQLLEVLRKNEEGFSGAFTYAAIGMALVAPDGHWLKVNNSLCNLVGYSEEELIQKSFQDITHPDDVENSLVEFRKLMAGKKASFHQEKRYLHKKGHVIWVSVSVSLLRDSEGAPLYFVAQTQDITERKLAEKELERLRSEYERILSAVEDGVHWIGLDGRIKFENPAAARMLGYRISELIGRPAHSIMHHTRADGTPYEVDECFIHKTLHDGEVRRVHDEVFWRKDGTSFDVEYTCTPIQNKGLPSGAVVTFVDVTQRKKVELEMQNARLAAESASRAKTDFLANMSHEIRTPLNGIIGMTDLLNGTRLTPEQRDFLETIHASGENLLTIVNDVLDFSKIEFGKLELDYHAFSLLDLLDDVVGLLNFRVAKKKLDFLFSIDRGLPVDYLGDATRIRQVLINLVANAIKFTEQGEISIEVGASPPKPADQPNARRLQFRVRDTGIGIPEDRLDRLFKVFSQVDASTTRRYGGSGLGLAICQKLVEIMGGTIRVDSRPGEGSTFSFELPLELAQVQNPAPGTSVLAGRRVLIVDDNETNRRMLALQLARWDMTWVETSSAAEALEILRTEHFDLALLDFQMPDTNGLMLARQIRQAAGHPSLPLVLVSSQTGDISMEELKQAGFSAVIAKPVRQNILRSSLQEVLSPAGPPSAVHLAGLNGKGPHRPIHILVVEDNVTNQKVAQQILKRLGYESDLAANGVEAVHAAESRSYDLILMDVHMPEMDGLEATRHIREKSALTGYPQIIALTADVLKGEREICLTAGMDDYITKPIKIEMLKVILERLPEKAGSISE
jgi:PAS domain S-box-containing protein